MGLLLIIDSGVVALHRMPLYPLVPPIGRQRLADGAALKFRRHAERGLGLISSSGVPPHESTAPKPPCASTEASATRGKGA